MPKGDLTEAVPALPVPRCTWHIFVESKGITPRLLTNENLIGMLEARYGAAVAQGDATKGALIVPDQS